MLFSPHPAMRGLSRAMIITIIATTVWAAAFPWDLPQATLASNSVVNLNPTITEAPENAAEHMVRRQQESKGETCAFESGLSTLPIFCKNSSYVCVTNAANSAHACCAPQDQRDCIIPTTCIPSASLSVACTDSACHNNKYIVKCADSASPACFELLIQFSTSTVMTEYGCATSATTRSAFHYYSVTLTGSSTQLSRISTFELANPSQVIYTVTYTPSTSMQPTSLAPSKPTSTNTGAIVGGVIGGLAILSATCLGLFVLWRKTKQKQKTENMPQTVADSSGNGDFAVDQKVHGEYNQVWPHLAEPNNLPVELQGECGVSEAIPEAEIHELPGDRAK